MKGWSLIFNKEVSVTEYLELSLCFLDGGRVHVIVGPFHSTDHERQWIRRLEQASTDFAERGLCRVVTEVFPHYPTNPRPAIDPAILLDCLLEEHHKETARVQRYLQKFSLN